MIKMSLHNSRGAPFVIEPEPASFDSLIETVFGRREFFREKLLAHGVLLFRGCRADNVANFERFVRVFSRRKLLNYAGGASPRTLLNESGIYTSTEYPPEVALSLHNEFCYADAFPAHLYFCCLTAPERGGETTFGDSRRILWKLDKTVVEAFRRKKICYIRNLSSEKGSGYSWQEAFETDCRLVAEGFCRKIGADFEWKPCGGLRLAQIRPATATHPVTGEEVWFNQAESFHPSRIDDDFETKSDDDFRLNCRYGDGTPIETETLRHIRAVLDAEAIPHRWQPGDILILDNILSAHGRRPFSGERKIVLAMT